MTSEPASVSFSNGHRDIPDEAVRAALLAIDRECSFAVSRGHVDERDVRTGLAAAWPLLRRQAYTQAAEAIDQEREASGSDEHPADAGYMHAMREAAALVRQMGENDD